MSLACHCALFSARRRLLLASLDTGTQAGQLVEVCRADLDPDIQRGTPKVFTGKEHLPVRLFRAEQQAIKREEAAAKAEENAALAPKMATEAGGGDVGRAD